MEGEAGAADGGSLAEARGGLGGGRLGMRGRWVGARGEGAGSRKPPHPHGLWLQQGPSRSHSGGGGHQGKGFAFTSNSGKIHSCLEVY